MKFKNKQEKINNFRLMIVFSVILKEVSLMTGSIAVTPEQLKSQARVYSQASSQIQDAIRKVNNMNQQIAQEWKGQAFQAYLEQYNQLEGNVKQMEQLLESINGQLNKYADTVAERDRQDASSFGF